MFGQLPPARLCGVLLAALPLPLPLPLVAVDEGIDHAVLKPAQPTETGDQVEVLEVFWYGCPHCGHLEPVMDQWVATKPAGVAFRRMPATGPRWEPPARAYYAAESLGRLDDGAAQPSPYRADRAQGVTWAGSSSGMPLACGLG